MVLRLPYTIIVFAVMPVLWKKAHNAGHVTAADVVHAAYGSRSLELAVALTCLVATMPYIALQLIGMEVVIKAMGPAADRGRLRDPRALYLQFGPAGARAHRLSQGHHNLRRGAVRRRRSAPQGGRLRRCLLGRQRGLRGEGRRDGVTLKPAQSLPYAALGSALAEFMTRTR
jgi:solute:Na+ symporter, SSS family